MAGLFQWPKVQRPKGDLDRQRGKLFAKLAPKVSAAARMDRIAAGPKKNRVGEDLGLIFSENRSKFVSSGSAACLFQRKQAAVRKAAVVDQKMLEIALGEGAETLTSDESHHILTTAPDQIYVVTEALKVFSVHAEFQRPTFIPGNSISVMDETLAGQVLKPIDPWENHDDALNVDRYFDAPEVLAKVSG